MGDTYEAFVAEQLPITSPITTPIAPERFFGIDGGWRNFQLGFAYKFLGQLSKARQHLKIVVNEHSLKPIY